MSVDLLYELNQLKQSVEELRNASMFEKVEAAEKCAESTLLLLDGIVNELTRGQNGQRT